MKFLRRHVATVAIVSILAAPTFAQQEKGRKGMMQDHAGHHMGGERHAMMMEKIHGDCPLAMAGKYTDGRLAFLKAELDITEKQQDAWSDFEKAYREWAKSTKQMHKGMKKSDKAKTLPERMERRHEMMSSRLDASRSLQRAIEPLYKQLSADQKQTADHLFRMVMM